MAENNWREETAARRSELIQAALRSFILGRQYLTEGKLSEAERLIRFYEGVTMSLDRNLSDDGFMDAKRAFQSVLRYDASNSSTNKQVQLLRLQATYNLAVVHHRHWQQAIERWQEKGWGPKTNKEDYEAARDNYLTAIFDAEREGPITEKTFPASATVRSKAAVFLAASLGIVTLFLSEQP